MRTEADVKKAVKRRLVETGAWYCMPHGAGYGRAGIPDFVVCLDGRFVAIECKFGKNRVTCHQSAELAAIQRANGIALVINETNLSVLDTVLNA